MIRAAWLFVFNTKVIFMANVKSINTKKYRLMNTPQVEGKVNSVLYSRTEKEGSTLFSNKKKNNEAQLLVYLK